jgi:predicted metal-binding membrane protein
MIELAARNERMIATAALAAVAGVSLLATVRAGDFLMMAPAALSPVAYVVLMLIMWWSMMVAMMLPSAAPTILLFGALSRKRAEAGQAVPIAAFAAGYVIIWGAFSIAAVVLHLSLDRFVPFDMMMQTQSLRLGGILLVAAGVYQLTPLKTSCLRRCQSPLMFLASHWRPGYGGALRMGLEHGLNCVGCCAVLMGLLFYGGVMDLWWIAGLALYVLIEKLVVRGPLLSRLSGSLLIAWGAVILWRAI